MGRLAGGRGQARTCASSSDGSRPKRLSGGASRRTSCVTPTPSNSLREGVALNVIQRQLGHANLGTTSIYLQGIDTEEIIATVHAGRAPMMSATAGLRL
jgi:integrase